MRFWFALLCAPLLGCPAVFESGYQDRVRDLDGDGATSTRFGGPDCADDNPDIVDCDADQDGFLSAESGGDDCDDTSAATHPEAVERCDGADNDCDGAIDNDDPDVQGERVYYRDRDGDGAGDPDTTVVCQELADPGNPGSALHALDGDDCNDRDEDVNPGATEICDGVDNDCDGVVDDAGLWYVDADGDGFGGTQQATGPCVLGPDDALSAVQGDCDDTDASIAPGAPETPYDGVDSNCNGGRDDWDADLDGAVPAAHFAAAQAANALLPPAEQWTLVSGDCDDTNPVRFDGNPEICDGFDNDCDFLVDAEDLEGADPGEEATLRSQVVDRFYDADGDGFFGTPLQICPGAIDPALHGTSADDCLDVASGEVDAAQVFPGAEEACDDVDNDCDGRIDWSPDPFEGSSTHYRDLDGDGVGATAVQACGVRPGIAAVGADCDDGDGEVYPGAIEVCGDSKRQDCRAASLFDCDADGFEGLYGGGGSGEDCDDVLPLVFPSDAEAAEICDGIDNDCDGLVDSADPENLDASDEPFWYVDGDGDGFGAAGSVGLQQCDRPTGYVLSATDCNDGDATLAPTTPWYADVDGDGYGDPATRVESCVAPFAGAVRVAGDCDDGSASLNPTTRWLRDDDGDFLGGSSPVGTFCEPPVGEPWVREIAGVDCNDDDATVTAGQVWYLDTDFDGFGQTAEAVESCVAPVVPNARYVDLAGDCDDEAANINPAAQESCNAADDDCDGHIDDADDSLVAGFGGPIGYVDLDGDGFGTTVAKVFCVAVPEDGWAPATGDCADDDPAVSPAALEVCGNGIDDDCDGEEQVPVWYTDADGDGYGVGTASAPHCDPPAASGFASRAGDCDDARATTHPGAPELDACDAIDSNCDGTPEPRLTWAFDRDGDGYGDAATEQISCSAPLQPPTPGELGAWVLTSGDCDDTDVTTTFGQIWYLDGDGDGLGNDASTQFACPQQDAEGNPLTVYLDLDVDGDGVFDPADGDRQLTAFAGDCDDGQPAIGAARNFYVDDDGDDWGDIETPPVFGCPAASGNPPDGFVTRTGDCDDDDATVNPDADEQDGDSVDQNCDGFLDSEQGIQWYPDADGDGLGDRNATATTSYVPGYRTNNVDCDDGNAAIGSGRWVYRDADEDGAGTGLAFYVGRCTLLDDEALSATDCDDADPTVRPGATETCDYVDDNCNGVIDEGTALLRAGFVDGDGDGQGGEPAFYCEDAPAGYATDGGDCDDTDDAVNDGATEVCDGIDNNCDGVVDPGVPWYLDADTDGYGGLARVDACAAPSAAWVAVAGDCDDSDLAVFPGAPVVACDGIDNDCNGLSAGEVDADGDGVLVCAGDCDDTTPLRAPGLPELCDGVADNDCNDVTVSPEGVDADGDGFDRCTDVDDTDDQVPVATTTFDWYQDLDGDGFGDPDVSVQSAGQPVGFVLNASDCDDAVATSYPGAPELCDGIDNDCDPANEPVVQTWYADLDADGVGGATSTATCDAPVGHVLSTGDCDDTDPQRTPGRTEICDGVLDNDCNAGTPSPEGVDADSDGFSSCADPADTDPDVPVSRIGWFADVDGDGFGDGAEVLAWTQPPGHVLNDADCDDGNSAVHPGATELCDGIDNDCVGGNEPTPPSWYLDDDGDGYGFGAATAACDAPSFAHVLLGGDCDDGEQQRNPGMRELCDGVADNDCDVGTTDLDSLDGDVDGVGFCLDPDDADPAVPYIPRWYRDQDADGYGDAADPAPIASYVAVAGRVANAADCDDDDVLVRPGIPERCNGVDDNCDGASVLGGVDVANPFTGTGIEGAPGDVFVADLDGDGLFSAATVVETCNLVGSATPSLAVDGDPSVYDLRRITLAGLELATDCEVADAAPGTVYVQDDDGDGVPGYTTLDDLSDGVYLDCAGQGAPAGFVAFTGAYDCAPADSDAYALADAIDRWIDEDGDGFRVSIASGTCAGGLFANSGSGVDCSDAHVDVTAGVTAATVNVGDQETLDALIGRCVDARLALNDPTLTVDLSLAQAGSKLRLRGSGAQGCANDADSCTALSSAAPPADLELTLTEIGLATTAPLGVRWNLDATQWTLNTATLRDLTLQLGNASSLTAWDSTWISGADDGGTAAFEGDHLVLEGGSSVTVDGLLMRSSVGTGTAIIVNDGSVEAVDLTIEAKDYGIELAGGDASAVVEHSTFRDLGASAVVVVDAGAVFTDVTFEHAGAASVLDLDGEALVDCLDCDLTSTTNGVRVFDAQLVWTGGRMHTATGIALVQDGEVEVYDAELVSEGSLVAHAGSTDAAVLLDGVTLRSDATGSVLQAPTVTAVEVTVDVPNGRVFETGVELDVVGVVGEARELALVTAAAVPNRLWEVDLTLTGGGAEAIRVGGALLDLLDVRLEGEVGTALWLDTNGTVNGVGVEVVGASNGVRMGGTSGSVLDLQESEIAVTARAFFDNTAGSSTATFADSTLRRISSASGNPLVHLNHSANVTLDHCTLWSDEPLNLVRSQGVSTGLSGIDILSSTLRSPVGTAMLDARSYGVIDGDASVYSWAGAGATSGAFVCSGFAGLNLEDGGWVQHATQLTGGGICTNTAGFQTEDDLGLVVFDSSYTQLWAPIAAVYGREAP